ncbi:MAG: signal recognition particle receptor, partial [Actinomycetota bacterium]
MEYIILIAVVLIFGLGVLLWSRSRRATGAQPTVEVGAPPVPTSPPEPVGDRAAEQREPAPDELVPEVAAPGEVPSFRTRMAKARGALAGALLGIRGRGGITPDTWDELEEALLRADVGVRVTDELLDGLKARVK